MYGWLSSDDTHRAGEITVLIPNWEPMTATTLTEVQRKARLGRLMPFVQLALAQDSGSTRDQGKAQQRANGGLLHLDCSY